VDAADAFHLTAKFPQSVGKAQAAAYKDFFPETGGERLQLGKTVHGGSQWLFHQHVATVLESAECVGEVAAARTGYDSQLL
jgi:hypothetical protein